MGFCTLLDGIKVLGISFGSFSFVSFFFYDALDGNACHVEVFKTYRCPLE
jgi:hypothetical protein